MYRLYTEVNVSTRFIKPRGEGGMLLILIYTYLYAP